MMLTHLHPPLQPRTERLQLRLWRDEDRAPFAALNADAEVMRHFPAPLAPEASDALAQRVAALLRERGWGWWAVERRDTAQFIGFIGLGLPMATLPFAPAVEVGWRLARSHWGQGFATEGAQAALRVAFDTLGLAEVVSFTAASNLRSQAVMRRLGLADAQAPFEHPNVPPGHPVRPHVLFRLRRQDWAAARPEPGRA